MVEKYDVTKLNAIYNKMNGLYRIRHSNDIIINYILDNVDKVEYFILNNYIKKLPTKKYYYGLLNKFLRDKNDPKYFEVNKKYKLLCNEINKINYNDNEYITKEKLQKLITWDKYIECYYTNQEKLDLQDLFMISLYVLQPPRRVKDYFLLQLNEGPNRLYYNEQNEMILELSDYKTSKRYGVYKSKITGDLKDIIDNYIKYYINQDNRFFNYSSSASLSNRIKRVNEIICGKPLTVNDLRHMYISSFLHRNPSTHDKKELAKHMGHSVMLQSLYNYRNLENERKS